MIEKGFYLTKSLIKEMTLVNGKKLNDLTEFLSNGANYLQEFVLEIRKSQEEVSKINELRYNDIKKRFDILAEIVRKSFENAGSKSDECFKYMYGVLSNREDEVCKKLELFTENQSNYHQENVKGIKNVKDKIVSYGA
jgi:hypothetical protein